MEATDAEGAGNLPQWPCTPEAVTDTEPVAADRLPRSVLYATSAGLGGAGLNTTSLEGAVAPEQAGILREVLCFGSQQSRIPRRRIRSLNWHPVRALSWLDSQRYYAAKKRYVARAAAVRLRRGDFDCFHGWSGDAYAALVEARHRGIPSLLDIPTWHRNKGRDKPTETQRERQERLNPSGRWRDRLPIPRKQMLAEYDLADLILVPSACSAETFLKAGVPSERLHYVGRGVDIERYQPGTPPESFRACFVGALIRRKGVHLLLEAWHKAGLADAKLVLVGHLHEEMKPELERWGNDQVVVKGFSKSVQDELRASSVFVFPSECEGFAKTTLEAAACGLPILGTRESGDAIVDGVTGKVIPPNDVEALVEGLRDAYRRQTEWAAMGRAGRERVERCLTWDHYRQRLLQGYARVMPGGNPR